MRTVTRALRPALALLLLELAALITVQPSNAQPASGGGASISVTATGDLLVVPDRAVFVIAIDSDAPTAAAAGAQNAHTHAAVMTALTSAGASAEELSTIGYSIEPRRTLNLGSSSTPPGYRVSSSIRVEISRLDHLGALIDAALTAGASGIGAIQFEPKDAQSVRQQALAQAVRKARADAEAMARAADGALGPLEELSVQPSNARPIGPLAPLAAAQASRPGEPSEMQAPELRIEVVVTGRWGFRPTGSAH